MHKMYNFYNYILLLKVLRTCIYRYVAFEVPKKKINVYSILKRGNLKLNEARKVKEEKKMATKIT